MYIVQTQTHIIQIEFHLFIRSPARILLAQRVRVCARARGYIHALNLFPPANLTVANALYNMFVEHTHT